MPQEPSHHRCIKHRKNRHEKAEIPAGLKLGIKPQYLLVPRELQTTAERLVSAVLATETGNVNVFAGQLKVMVSDQLEDPKAWYLGRSFSHFSRRHRVRLPQWSGWT